ncbi:MAG TPA: hypothetical protein VNL77_20830, partial [Roseiflexaceae bacterium]|nr:hypothetical protein [Roseiflexaceae bacterium]
IAQVAIYNPTFPIDVAPIGNGNCCAPTWCDATAATGMRRRRPACGGDRHATATGMRRDGGDRHATAATGMR